MPPQNKLNEKTWFISDDETDPRKKNSLLATHLDGTWKRLQIVKIERIEIGDKGWIATYRTKTSSKKKSGTASKK